jgi:hypothetical protein
MVSVLLHVYLSPQKHVYCASAFNKDPFLFFFFSLSLSLFLKKKLLCHNMLSVMGQSRKLEAKKKKVDLTLSCSVHWFCNYTFNGLSKFSTYYAVSVILTSLSNIGIQFALPYLCILETLMLHHFVDRRKFRAHLSTYNLAWISGSCKSYCVSLLGILCCVIFTLMISVTDCCICTVLLFPSGLRSASVIPILDMY